MWFSERSLHEQGAVEHGMEKLRAQGHVFEVDGAVWLRTTDFGDDKDRVMTKSDGSLTYFASDTAYYINKRERGFDNHFPELDYQVPQLQLIGRSNPFDFLGH